MILRYNSLQIIVALMAIIGGAFFTWIGWLFFRWIPVFLFYQFGSELSSQTADLIGTMGLLAIYFSGYRQWKAKGGLRSYHESALYHELTIESGGAAAVDLYAHRITAPAHVLSQLFLAGPLLLFKACSNFASLISRAEGMEERTGRVLSELRAANKWQGFQDHPNAREEILLLAQMGQIDFGIVKGVPRFKAELDD